MVKSGVIKLSLIASMSFAFTALASIDTQVVLKAPAVNADFKAEKVEAAESEKPIMLAKKKKKKSKSRKRILSSEKKFKSKKGGSTSLDFDAADVTGQRKTPLGSLVGNTSSKRGGGFVEIRKQWHNEMVQSASKLD